MNNFSQHIYNTLLRKFPEYNKTECPDQDCLEFYIPVRDDKPIGGLIIQTTLENNIWIRIAPGHSAYLVDDNFELIKIIKGTIEDKILWVIGFRENKWHISILIEYMNQLEIEEGIKYYIYSWSGKLDKKI